MLLGVIVCWGYWFGSQKLAYVPRLRIGLNAYSGSEYMIVAKKLHLFRKHGLRVQLVEFGSLGDVQQAFEWGQIDAMVCNLIDVMVVLQKNKSIKAQIVFIPSYPKPQRSYQLLVQPSIHTIQDLKGQKVGVEINSMGGFVLQRAMRSGFCTFKDIELYPVDPTAYCNFVTKKQLAAVVAYPPYSEALLEPPLNLHCLYSTEDWPKEMKLNVLLIRNSALEKFHKDLKNFVAAWDNILNEIKQNWDKSLRFLARHCALPLPEADRILSAIEPLSLEDQVRLFNRYKYLIYVVNIISAELLKNNNLYSDANALTFSTLFNPVLFQQFLKVPNEKVFSF